MQKFTVVNENLLFKDATVLFKFNLTNDDNDYLLYYLTDLDNYNDKLMVAVLKKDLEYVRLSDLEENNDGRAVSYINKLIEGNGKKKEIKISNDNIEFEPNVCQSVKESSVNIECSNVRDVLYAINNISKDFFGEFVYLNDLNTAMCEVISQRNKIDSDLKEKENIKGNVNIFLLTLFAVCFLTVLIFMGFGLFVNP